MDRKDEVLNELRGIIDPDLGKDIVTLGFIKNLTASENGSVAFVVELTTPACPLKAQFKSDCEKAVSRLPWVQSVDVVMSAARRKSALAPRAPGLEGVQNIVAVSSCKGGVGKSTVALNLAFTMARAGARVGLFDADIYGPSLPTLVRLENPELVQKDGMIQPLEYEGVRLMSFGFAPGMPGNEAAIMRGPMVTNIINQLVTGTEWGELDYLVVDMPPGTGDIPLTLSQILPLAGAVIVTTPQKLSFIDVVRGIRMFDKLNVPTTAVVENMSYFICGSCGERHEIFGQGARDRLVREFGIRNSFEIPIDPDVSRLGDQGTPLVMEQPGCDVARCYQAIVDAVVRQISAHRFGGREKPTVSSDPDHGIVVSLDGEKECTIHPAALRRRCRCAECVDEMTGGQILKPEDVGDDVNPKSIERLGNYAVTISWSDGHSSVFPFTTLLEEF